MAARLERFESHLATVAAEQFEAEVPQEVASQQAGQPPVAMVSRLRRGGAGDQDRHFQAVGLAICRIQDQSGVSGDTVDGAAYAQPCDAPRVAVKIDPVQIIAKERLRIGWMQYGAVAPGVDEERDFTDGALLKRDPDSNEGGTAAGD